MAALAGNQTGHVEWGTTFIATQLCELSVPYVVASQLLSVQCRASGQ